MLSRLQKGRKAERMAARHLKKKGYKILTKNWYGRRGELDIIARDGDVLVVVEVRSRGEGSPYIAEQSITPSKRRHLSRTATELIRKHQIRQASLRIDLVVVDWVKDEIRHYPGGIEPVPRA